MSDLGQIEFLPPLVERVQRDAPGVRLEAVGAGSRGHRRRAGGGRARPRRRLPAGARRAGAAPSRCSGTRMLCLMRADHPVTKAPDAARSFSRRRMRWCRYRGGHRVIEEALERAGARAAHRAARAALHRGADGARAHRPASSRCPRAWRAFTSGAASSKALPPPVPIPPAEVAVHWHERFEADPGNRWLRDADRGAVRRLKSRPRASGRPGSRFRGNETVRSPAKAGVTYESDRAFSSLVGSGARFSRWSQ